MIRQGLHEFNIVFWDTLLPTTEILRLNLLSPLALAFALGVVTKVARCELSLPKDLYTSLSIYLFCSHSD